MSQPFFLTWSAQRGGKALEMTGGDGPFFTTSDGGRWLDLGSLSYQAHLGHSEKRVADAIKRQADGLCVVTPNANFPAKRELAERLLALAPEGFTKVFFTLGGSEANENAIKMARLFTGRHKLMSRYRSYHGATLGALALSGDWRRPPLEPALPGVVHALDSYCDRCPFGQKLESCKRECATHIADVMTLEGPRTIAAVFLEPVPGANGVLIPPPEYWPTVRAACDAHGTLLVADEVLTGFGRTGKCFGFEHFGVVPDLITVAKGLTAGYASLGAVLVHEKVASFFEDNVLVAGLTNYGQPIACAAAVAALKVYEDDGLYNRAAALGPVLGRELRSIQSKLPQAVEFVRGLGLLWAMELNLSAAGWDTLGKELAQRRLYLHVDRKRGLVVFAPPLIIDEAVMCEGVQAFGEAVSAAARAS